MKNNELTYQLSCVVPVYNVEQYIEECVESLLKIPLERFEIILINDGSTDLSGSILDRYSKQYEFVKVIHQVNLGVSAARNRGIDEANGEYIAFVDSDDWILPEKLSDLYEIAKQNAVDLAMGNIIFLYPDGIEYSPFLPVPESAIGQVLSGHICFEVLFSAQKMSPMVMSYLFRSEWIKQHKLRFEPVTHEDELWCVEALCLADSIFCTDLSFYYYRKRSGSIMDTLDAEKRINSLLYIANRIIRFSEKFRKESKSETWGLLYTKAAQLYEIAFHILENKRDSRFLINTHSLYQIHQSWHHFSPEVRSLSLFSYKNARLKLKKYHSWLISDEVTGVPKEIPIETKVILFYSFLWGAPLTYPKDQVPEGILITSDHRYIDRADIVVFHLPTILTDLEEDLTKSEKQRWVGWTLECEENYPFFKSTEFMSLFDYWMSYHKEADIQFPYYEYDYPVRLQQSLLSENLQKNVCMLISSPFNQSGRMEYLEELMQYIPIDSYGKLYTNCRMEQDNGHADKMALYNQYKFVIAFENSCADDYVTEKFFDPLLAGAIPVYFGAPNIDEFAPGENCYVDVRKYKSPKELADHLDDCCHDPLLYSQYQNWRNKPFRTEFLKKTEGQKLHPFIRLCHLIKNEKPLHPAKHAVDGKFYPCSFGDSRYQESRKRLQEQALDFDLFDSIYLCDESDLSPSFQSDFRSYLQPDVKGFGYWVWKPRIILDTLEKMDGGDVLLYVDMGCHLNSYGVEKMVSYWKEVKQNASGFLVSQLESERQESFWTKGDLLDYFQIRDDSKMYSPQYQAGVLFIRKEEKTMSLIHSWMDIFYHDFHLVDDTPSLAPNEEGFVAHRHDQSVFSILLKKHGTSVIPLEEVYRPKWNLYSRYCPILIKRDLR